MEEEEELPASLEDIFKLKPEMLDLPDEGDDLSEEESDPRKQKKQRRKKYVDVEYDPEQDVTIYRKKRKRGSSTLDDWDDDWDF